MTVAPQSQPTLDAYFAVVNGLRMHYRQRGQGELVVLLHGFPQTSYAWRLIMPQLARQYTVLAPDLRGLGDTDKPADGYDKRTIAQDVYGLVRQLGYDRFRLVGHDFGGSVAYALAAVYPEAVRQLVLVECMPAGLLSDDDTQRIVSRQLAGRTWFQGFHLVPGLAEALVAGREQIYLGWLFEAFTVQRKAITEADFAEYVRAYALPGSMHAAFGYYRATATDVLHNRASAQHKLRMPVLTLGGEGSLGDATYHCLTAAATQVQGAVLADCGHFVAEEQASAFLAHLQAFFSNEA